MDFAQLEDRVLLSASPAGAQVLTDAQALGSAGDMDMDMAADADVNQAMAWPEPTTDADPAAEAVPQDALDDLLGQQLPLDSSSGDQKSDTVGQTHELVLVDTGAQDYQQLVDDLLAERNDGRQIDVVLLDSTQDGIDQITQILAGYDDLDAIHLVSHGTDRAVKLGSTWLELGNVDAYAGQIASWNDALATDADLLIYGCDLADGEDGRTLIEGISQLTGADVAASVDDTGNALLGGDWDLEYQTGNIEATVAFSADVQQNWTGLLNTFTVTNTNDSGAGSLRQAILDANALGGTDTIQFNIAATDAGHYYYQDDGVAGQVTLGNIAVTTEASDASIEGIDPDFAKSWYSIQVASSLPTISDAVVIDGTTQAGYTDSPIIELDGSGQGGVDGLYITAGNSTIRGLVINRFAGDGIQIDTAGGNTIAGNYIGTDVSGTLDQGNLSYGIYVDTVVAANTIGGTGTADRNVISGNNDAGIYLSQSDNQVIQGNIIGLNAAGDADLGNLHGIELYTSDDNLIGGTAAGSRNIISGNVSEGIYTRSGSGWTVIQGNYIGTDISGMVALGNSGFGIHNDSSYTQIGGTAAAARNVISGNVKSGILLNDATFTTIQGNYIGVDATGSGALGNSQRGIRLFLDSRDNTIGGTAPGAGNIIAYNARDGVRLDGKDAYDNTIRGNSIFANGELGIDLNDDGVTTNDAGDGDWNGANKLQNFPVLSSAVSAGGNTDIRGTINSTASTTFDLDFYLSPTADDSGYGEGEVYLGSAQVTTDASGNATINTTLVGVSVATGHVITATATDPSGNTSEFSCAVPVNTVVVNTTSDVADGDTSSIAALLNDRGADGFVSLREAITATNNTANGATPDEIWFNIGATDAGHFYYQDDSVAGQVTLGNVAVTTEANDGDILDIDPDFAKSWYSIQVASALPTITDAVDIDGTTQSGFIDSPIIELDGSAAGASVTGLAINAGNSTLRGLIVNRFDFHGVVLGGDGSTVAGNYLGTDASGTVDLHNTRSQIRVISGLNTIGGNDVADRNVIAGAGWYGIEFGFFGGDNNLVQGNYIGVDATGTSVMGSSTAILVDSGSNGNTIGGTTAGAGNVISGSSQYGVEIRSNSNELYGNLIGTNPDGDAAWGNDYGIRISGGSGNTIGGTTAGHRNVVSGNTTAGIYLSSASSTVIQGNYVGTDIDGTGALGNGTGIMLISSSNNVIGGIGAGEGNVVAHNAGHGIFATVAGTGNAVRGNSVHSNADLGIDWGGDGVTANDAGDGDSGDNNLQNYPVLSNAISVGGNTSIWGTINSTATTTLDIDFYSSSVADGTGYGEGEVYLGSTQVATDGSGNATINEFLAGVTVTAGHVVTATATDSSGNTSEFSLTVTATDNLLVVDTTSDVADGNTTSIAALLANRGADGYISLREAITATNNTANGGSPDEIRFDIADPLIAGAHTIVVGAGGLPEITDAVVIDGTTEPDFAGTPIIELDGSSAGADVNGLHIAAGNSTVRGLVINRFDGSGIQVDTVGGNTIVGNYIGTDVTGSLDLGNDDSGIVFHDGSNTVGGTDAADRNVISGNTYYGIYITGGANNNLIQGNYIGLDAAGNAAIGNGNGIRVRSNANGNTIGGTTAGAGNVISGHAGDGVMLESDNNLVAGNLIGTNAAGDAALGNRYGIYASFGTSNTIGGTTAGHRNVISANTVGIYFLSTAGNTVQGNYIGVDITGTGALGNTDGIFLISSNNVIGGIGAGQANVVAHNAGNGIAVSAGITGNEVRGNAIHSNGDLGIDLGWDGVTANDPGDGDTGANNLQNFPALSNAVSVSGNTSIWGTINSTASTTFDIDFYSSPTADGSGYGEGEVYLGSTQVTTDGSGNATINEFLAGVTVTAGHVVTATATDPSGNTSEFSLAVTAMDNLLVVDTTSDTLDGNTTSIAALLADRGADGFISLREAVTATNNTANGATADEIHFDIAAPLVAGAHTIQPGSPLPTISDAVIIDGTTEPDFAGTPIIELDGSSTGAGSAGLQIASGDSTVRGLVINRFTFGVLITSAGGNVLEGNYIGTDFTGTVDRGNTFAGVYISSVTDANTIGGTTATAGNVISGNGYGVFLSDADNQVIQGNIVGLDASGTAALGNAYEGIYVQSDSDGALIGGTAPGARNIISGNWREGLLLKGSSATVQGNYIGTDITGMLDLGNSYDGIKVEFGINNQIGSVTAAARNVIAGNGWSGINLSGASGTTIEGNYIGVDATGSGALGNSFSGILISGASTANTIGGTAAGAGNVIANSGRDGVYIGSSTATGNAIIGNSIFSNTELGIDLGLDGVTANDLGDADTGDNNLQNFPDLVAATVRGGNTTVYGSLNSTASTTFDIHFYSSPSADGSGYGEGQVYLGSAQVTTDASGNAEISVTLPVSVTLGHVITATATDPSGNTSEFSLAVTALDNQPPVATDDGYSVDEDGVLTVATGDSLTEHEITTTADGAWSVYAADVDGDGDLDVLSASSNDYTIAWFENDGSENFTIHTITTTANGASSVHAVDVDGDGDMDVLSASYLDDTIAWYENDGSENFTIHTITTTADGASSVHAVDVDGDGDMDVLSASRLDFTIAWYENDGSEIFAAHAITTTADYHYSVYAGDVDGDGDMDVLSASLWDTIAWYENDGSQNFAAHNITTTADYAASVYAADVDGDGDLDVLSASSSDDTIAWYENDGAGVLFNDTDVEDDPLTAILVSGPTDGVLELNDSGSFVYTPDADFYGTDTFTYKANDGTDDSNVATVTITVNPINDAPVEASIEVGALAYTENDGAVAVTGSITISDLDDTNIESAVIRITAAYVNGEDVLAFADTGSIAGSWDALTGTLTLTGTDTLSNYDAALRSVTYQNTSDDPDTATRTVSFTVNDGDVDSNTQSRDVAITAENDAPVEASIEAGVLAYTENDGQVAVTGSITISDLDDTNIESAVIQITAAYVNGEDVLAFTDTGSITGSWDALTGKLTLTGTDTLANYDLALRSVTYQNTSDDPSTATRTVSFTVNDGDVDSNTQARDIALTAENDAPVEASIEAEAGALAYTENDGAVAVTGSITISDLDDTNIESAVIQITAAYVNGEDVLAFTDTGSITGSWDALTGTLTLTGTDTLANYDLALRSVTYQNTSDDPSTTTRTVSFTVNDGDVDSNTQSRDIAVTAENDAPVEASIEAGALAYTENDGAVAITGSITISDLDDTNIESAVIQVTTAYVNGEDVLAFTDTGSITGSWDALTGTLTLTGTDTLANYDLALRSVTYQNTSDDPSTTTRTVSFTVNDGDVDSNTQSRDIALTAENNAQVEASIEAGALAYTENDGQVAVTGSITISDLDDTNIESAVIQITAAYVDGEDVLAFTDTGSITGSWDALTGTLTLTGTDTLANYDLALRSVTYQNTSDDPSTTTRTVSFTVNDGDVDSNTQSRDIALTAENDAPVEASIEAGALAYTENDGQVAVTASITISDLDDTNIESAVIQITAAYVSGEDTLAFTDTGSITGSWDALTGTLTLTGTDTLANYDLALRSVTYQNSSDDPDTTTRTVSFTVNDGDVDSNTQSRDIALTAENDAPVEASIEAGALAYTENDGQVAVTASITISDLDDTNIESAVIQITAAYVNGEDVLAFADTGSITGSWDALTGTLTLTGTDTLANYDLALRSVTYQNTSDDPSTATRTVSFTVNDGDVDSNTQSRDIAITAENDPAVLDLDANDSAASGADFATTFTEDGGAVAVADADATLSDVDDTNLSALTVTITNQLDGVSETLAANTAGTSITASYNSGTGVLTLSGVDTVAHYQQVLRTVTYDNSSQDPDTTARTLTFVANDGTDPSNVGTTTVTMVAQNDAPQLDLDANDSAASGADFATTFTEDGGAVTVADADATLSDVDDTNLSSLSVTITNQLDGVSETLAANTAGTSITASYNSGTGVLTLSGVDTVARYEQVLRTVTYDNTSQDPDTTARSITFVANDGTDPSNVGTTTVTMVAQNDPAVLDLDANDSAASGADFATTFTEDGGAVAVADADAALSDVDNTNLSSLTVTITNQLDGVSETLAANTAGTSITASYNSGTGVLTLSGVDTVAHYQQVLRTVTYDNSSQDPDTTARTITFVANDGTDDSNVGTTTVTMVAQNDPAVLDLDANDSAASGADFATTFTEDGGAVAVADTDATLSDVDNTNFSSLSVTITNQLDGASETLAANTAGTPITASYNSGTGILTLSGVDTVAHYEQVLRTVTYNNTSQNPDTTARTITFVANDGTDDSNVGTTTVTMVAQNDAPVLDLDADNSSEAAGADYLTTFTEDGGPVAVADVADATLTDADLEDLISLTVTITNQLDGASEVLSANTAGTSITASYSSGTGILTLSGVDTAAHYQQVLRTVTYENTSQNPHTTARTITFVADDGTEASNVAVTTVGLAAQNDAPVAIGESYAVDSNATLQVAAPGLLGNDTDADFDPLSTVLVTSVSHGTLLFGPDGSFAYVPDVTFGGTDSFTYQASDGSASSNITTVTIQVNRVIGPPPPPPPPPDPDPDPIEDDEPPPDDEGGDSPPLTPPPREESKSGLRDRSQAVPDLRLGDMETAYFDSEDRWLVGGIADETIFVSMRRPSLVDYDRESSPETAGLYWYHAVPDSDLLWDQLDQLWDQVRSGEGLDQLQGWQDTLTIGTATVLSSALSAGYLFWMMRGGYLLASFASSLPAWRTIDPLPILDDHRQLATLDAGDPEQEYNSLQAFVKRSGLDPSMRI